jgi:hypothetical protein
MDSSFVPSDSSDNESLPELAELLQWPVSKVQRVQRTLTTLPTSTPTSPNRPPSIEPHQPVEIGKPLPKRSKQRALKKKDLTNVMLSPLKETVNSISKSKSPRKLEAGLEKDVQSQKLSYTPSRLRSKVSQVRDAPNKDLLDHLDLKCGEPKDEANDQASLKPDSDSTPSKRDVSRPTSSYNDSGAFLS